MNRARAICSAAVLALGAPVLITADAVAESAGVASIYYDEYGVPHLFAGSMKALAFAQGYVHTKDRMWAMDVFRHAGRGELAFLIGSDGLALDTKTRRLGYNGCTIEQQWNQLKASTDPVVQENVDWFYWYAAGVNTAADELIATGDEPLEFGALQHEWEPWSALDSAAWAIWLVQNQPEGGDEVVNARLLDHLQDKLPASQYENAFNDVVPGTSTGVQATISTTYAHASLLPQPKALSALPAAQTTALNAARDALDFGLDVQPPADSLARWADMPINSYHFKLGSNAVAIAPSKSANGRALLGGGPQNAYMNPGFGYEIGLHCTGTPADCPGQADTVGVGFVGMPGMIYGRAKNYAWTVTSAVADQADMIALESAGPGKLKWPTAANPANTIDLQCFTSNHSVVVPAVVSLSRNQPPSYQNVAQPLCTTQYGPVFAKSNVSGTDWYFVRRTPLRGRELHSMFAALRAGYHADINGLKSGTVDKIELSLTYMAAGEKNVANPAVEESACFYLAGRLANRNTALDPRFPTPAGQTYDWNGYLAPAQMPGECNPSSGYYATWNNLPQNGFPIGDLHQWWTNVHRAERLDAAVQSALGAHGTLTLAHVKAIIKEAATHDTFAGEIAPVLRSGVSNTASTKLADWGTAGHTWTATETIGGDEHYSHEGHAVYDAAVSLMLEKVLGDELGTSGGILGQDHFLRTVSFEPFLADDGSGASPPRPFRHPDPHAADHGTGFAHPFGLLVKALSGGAAYNWCDDVNTGTVETCATMRSTVFSSAAVTAAAATKRPIHETEVQSLGLMEVYFLPMTNRATFNHFHVGTDTTSTVTVLAPGNAAHAGAPEGATFAAIAAGQCTASNSGQPCDTSSPGNLCGACAEHPWPPVGSWNQLPLYRDFEYKSVLFTRPPGASDDQVGLPAVRIDAHARPDYGVLGGGGANLCL